MIPLPWKLGALALVLGLCSVSSYVLGRKHLKQAWMAERAAVAAETARLRGQQEERERMWAEAMKVAGEKWDARVTQIDRSHDAYLDRLRDAYQRSNRVRPAAPAPAGCPTPSGPTAAELFREASALAAAVRDADRDRAALMACLDAWPR